MPVDICKIFGKGVKSLSIDELPLISEVIRYFFYIQLNLKYYSESKARNLVMKNLKNVWKIHEISTVSDCRIEFLLKKLWNERKKVLKSVNSKYFQTKRNLLKAKSNVLFDISLEKNEKVRLSEKALTFLNQQRKPRPMFKKLGNVSENERILIKEEHFEEESGLETEEDLENERDLENENHLINEENWICESDEDEIEVKRFKKEDEIYSIDQYNNGNTNTPIIHLPTSSAIADIATMSQIEHLLQLHLGC